jgi:hypothetical protein
MSAPKLSKEDKDKLLKLLKTTHKAKDSEIDIVVKLAEKEGGWDPVKVKKWYATAHVPSAASAPPGPPGPPR